MKEDPEQILAIQNMEKVIDTTLSAYHIYKNASILWGPNVDIATLAFFRVSFEKAFNGLVLLCDATDPIDKDFIIAAIGAYNKKKVVGFKSTVHSMLKKPICDHAIQPDED